MMERPIDNIDRIGVRIGVKSSVLAKTCGVSMQKDCQGF